MKKIISIFALLVLLLSCSNEEKSLPATIASLGVNTRISNSGTRASTGILVGTQFPSSSQIKVVAVGDKYTVQNSIYQWSTNWSTSNQILLTNNLATIYSYYPVDAEIVGELKNDDSNAIKVYETTATPESMTGEKDIDYMYAVPTYADGQTGVSNIYPNVNLDFKHVLAKLTFIINKSPDYPWQGKLSMIKFSDDLSPFKAQPQEMYIKDGTFKASTNTEAVKQFVPSSVLSINNESTSDVVTARVLLYPRTKNQADADKTKLILKIDDHIMTLDLASAGDQSNWEGGKNYIFKLIVKPTELKLSSITINKWNGVDSGSAIID